jgi:hypothetical protein
VVRDIRTIEEEDAKNPQRLSDHFEQYLQTKALTSKLQPFLRRNGPKIFLTGKTPHIYEPSASVLNRLIVLVLSKMNAFSWIPGPVEGEPTPLKSGGYEVKLGKADPIYFDRILLRHGPQPALFRSLHPIWHASAPLKAVWDLVDASNDATRKRNWLPGYFGPEIEMSSEPNCGLKDLVPADAPVHAQRIIMSRDIQDDGGSISSYFVDGLCVKQVEVKAIRFHASVATGRMGVPERDALGEQLGLTWKPDHDSEVQEGDTHEATFRKAPRVSGVFELAFPLGPDTAPISFGFRVSQLNADAFSPWEAEQLRSEHLRAWQPVASEQFSATVSWFPLLS